MSFINLANVQKSYGAHQVIHNATLSINAGEVIALIGKSGSGKSTLLRCLNGLERISGGSITIGDTPMSYEKAKLRALRRRVAIVFQGYNLFPHLTVEENVALAPRVTGKASGREALALAHGFLDRVGLTEKYKAHPRDLSGGQQQRVAIARALAVQPEILLLDEVTAALDPELVGEVLKVLGELAKQGLTMILVTHEIAFAQKAAHRVAFMHQGHLHEVGPAAQTITNPQTAELQKFLSAVH